MLSTINELAKTVNAPPIGGDFSQRKAGLYALLDQVARVRNIPIPTHRELELESFSKTKFSYSVHDYMLSLSPLLLVDPVEIPQQFLNTENYQGLRDWLSEKLGIEKREIVTDEKKHIKLYFELLKNLPLAKEAVKYLFLDGLEKRPDSSDNLIVETLLFILAVFLISSYPLVSFCIFGAILIQQLSGIFLNKPEPNSILAQEKARCLNGYRYFSKTAYALSL